MLLTEKLVISIVGCQINVHNKRMLADYFSAALKNSRKCERYTAMERTS